MGTYWTMLRAFCEVPGFPRAVAVPSGSSGTS